MNRPALSRRRFLRTAGEAVGAVGVASLGNALLPALTARAAEITTTDLGGLFLLDGAGANVLAMPGEDGALMIDGGSPRTPKRCSAPSLRRPATSACIR